MKEKIRKLYLYGYGITKISKITGIYYKIVREYCDDIFRTREEQNQKTKELKIKENLKLKDRIIQLSQYTIKDISKKLNINENKIRYICEKYNIKYKKYHIDRKYYINNEYVKYVKKICKCGNNIFQNNTDLCEQCIEKRNINIINNYITAKLTFFDLAKKYNCSRSNISKILIREIGKEQIKKINIKRTLKIGNKPIDKKLLKIRKEKKEIKKIFLNRIQKMFIDEKDFSEIINEFKKEYSKVEKINRIKGGKYLTWKKEIIKFCRRNKIKYRKCNYCKELTYNNKYCGIECMSKSIKLRKVKSDNLKEKWKTNNFRKKQAKARENKPIYWETEKLIEQELIKLNILYIHQKEINGYNVDFYLPDYRIIIECDGDYWHANKNIFPNQKYIYDPQYKNGRLSVEDVRMRDEYKNKIFINNGYKIIRFWENEIKKNIDECIKKLNILINNTNIKHKKPID